MATLTRRADALASKSAPTPVTAPAAVTPATNSGAQAGQEPVSRAVGTPAVSAPPAAEESALGEGNPLRKAEAEIVEFLRQPSSLEAVKRANPERAEQAIAAAIAYVTDRGNQEQWFNLVRCRPQTILDSVRKLAAVGLCVSNDAGTAFLVPRFDKKLDNGPGNAPGGMVCTPVPGVRGFESVILTNCPEATIETNVIRDQDSIDVSEGTDPKLVFRRNFRMDPKKPNPIIGSYCVIRERPGVTRVQIKTTQITETKEDEGTPKERLKWTTHDGRTITVGRMGPEAACRYVSQRACMREVARTWLKGNARVEALLQMEDEHLRSGEDVAGTGRRVTRGAGERNSGPKVEITATKGPSLPAAEIAAGDAAESADQTSRVAVGV